MFEEREVQYALPWLHGKLKLGAEYNLYYMVGNLREGKHRLYYNHWTLQNARPIWAPKNELRMVQNRINEHIISKFPRPSCCYGFSGGSCLQATKKHLGFRSVFMFDLRHAFSQVTHQDVFSSLFREGGKNPFLSFYTARFVANLCTVGEVEESFEDYKSWGGFLPQGAPTSPRLFDLCMGPLDEILIQWSSRFNLEYTRYADNLYFSSHETEFPKLARATVLSEVRKRFDVHKLRQVSHGDMCRMLGLNLKSGLVFNTRDFKRSFRGAMHHLEYVLSHDLPYQEAWAVVKGYWGFAVKDSLPEALCAKFESLKQQIHLLEWGW